MSEQVTRCGCTPVSRSGYDTLAGTHPSSAVVEAVAAARGTPPSEVAPLYDVIDLEALDRLFDHANADGRDASPSIRFSVGDHIVNVYADGKVLVCSHEE